MEQDFLAERKNSLDAEQSSGQRWTSIVSGETFALPRRTEQNGNTRVERVSAQGNPNDYYVSEGTRLYQMGNVKESFNYFMKAARGGDSRAALQVGFCYEQGIGVAQDYKAAAAWYQQSAEGGNAQAMKNLGQFLEYGVGVQEDWVKAAQWYERGARMGNADAAAALARAYQFGVGVPQDRQAALSWDKRAYQMGNQESLEWIRKLSNPLNNIGFRNDDERDMVMGTRLRTSGLLMGADPAGIAFKNSGERIAWLQNFANQVDSDERASAQRQRQLQWQRGYNQSPFVPNPWERKGDYNQNPNPNPNPNPSPGFDTNPGPNPGFDIQLNPNPNPIPNPNRRPSPFR